MRSVLYAVVLTALGGCAEVSSEVAAPPQRTATATVPAATAVATIPGGQRGGGLPYEIIGSEVWNIPDPVSGRDYQVFVALPPSYADDPERRYPVLYATDADYAFPLLRQIARRLNGHGPAIEDFILVGLSYAIGEDGMSSRRRDYTPTAIGAASAPQDAVHGGGAAYLAYLRDEVLPFVTQRYRIDESQRHYLGHSYGGLLGTQILLTQPELFAGYILGSPSYWYDPAAMADMESAFAAANTDLAARVYIYIGQYEETHPGDPRYARRHNMVSDARRMTEALRSRHYPSLELKLEVLPDEDHLSVAPGGFTRGLRYLLATEPTGRTGR